MDRDHYRQSWVPKLVYLLFVSLDILTIITQELIGLKYFVWKTRLNHGNFISLALTF